MTLLRTTKKFLSLVFPTSSSNVCIGFAVSSQDASSLDNLDLARGGVGGPAGFSAGRLSRPQTAETV